MGNKLPPKRVNQLCHKLAVLSDLMSDTLSDLDDVGLGNEDFKNTCIKAKRYADEFLEASYKVKGVRMSTYLGDLSNKVDSVIRNNYREIYG